MLSAKQVVMKVLVFFLSLLKFLNLLIICRFAFVIVIWMCFILLAFIAIGWLLFAFSCPRKPTSVIVKIMQTVKSTI